MTVDQTAAAIQAKMRTVRREVGEDVEEIVESARTLTDWRHYVRRYPLVAVGAAAALGYLVVPPRYRVTVSPVAAVNNDAKSDARSEQAANRGALKGALISMATNAAMRAASTWLSGQVSNYADQHLKNFGIPTGPTGPASKPPGPSPTGPSE